MIKDFDNDQKMAELGRYYATTKAIRKAKESIRDIAVTVLNGRYGHDELNAYHAKMDGLFNELKDAVSILSNSHDDEAHPF